MKFELKDKTGKDFSVALGEINDEKIVAGKKKKKDELKKLGFIFNTDAQKNYWLASFLLEDSHVFSDKDDKIHITISNDGTLTATKENKSELTQVEKQKVYAVVKKMYELLGVKETEYKTVEEQVSDKKGIGASSANPASAHLPPNNTYHNHLTTYADALNASLASIQYKVNTKNSTLEHFDATGKLTGHKVTVNADGSTKGDLFSDFGDTDILASEIAYDHIAVVKMHLELLKKGIKPNKKINLFLIEEGLTPEQKKLVAEVKDKEKDILFKEFSKPEYNDIKEFIVYDGLPLQKKLILAEPKPAAVSPKPEPTSEKTFTQKITTGEDTGKMWLNSYNVIDIPIYILQKYRHNFTKVNPRFDLKLEEIKAGGGSKYLSKPYPAYLELNESKNHFVLVWVDKENNLHYYNSMSGDPKVKEKELREKFPGFSSYEVEYTKEQTKENEAWSCGYRVARKILELESENDADLQKHPLVQAKTAEQIRDAFVAEAKECYVTKIKLIRDFMFEDATRFDSTQEGKLQYYEISEASNKALFDAIANLDATKLKEGIAELCKSNPKFCHALIETAPHYIYYNNGGDNKLGGGENGLGRNELGMELMEARNELFRARDKKHTLIVNAEELRQKARNERGEVDNLVGAKEAERKSIIELMRLVRTALKAKAEASSEPRMSPRVTK